MAIDENMDPVVADHARDLGIDDVAHVAPAVERRANACGRSATAIPAVAVARDLEPAAIVGLEQSGHQAPGWMVAEIAGEIADAETPCTRRHRTPRRWRRQHRLRPAACNRELLCGRGRQ